MGEWNGMEYRNIGMGEWNGVSEWEMECTVGNSRIYHFNMI